MATVERERKGGEERERAHAREYVCLTIHYPIQRNSTFESSALFVLEMTI